RATGKCSAGVRCLPCPRVAMSPAYQSRAQPRRTADARRASRCTGSYARIPGLGRGHQHVQFSCVFHVVFYQPEIPGTAGNAIRLAAGAGGALHLVGPLGFDVNDARLRRAGLDYHDRAALQVHTDLSAAWAAIRPNRVFAFTVQATQSHDGQCYTPGDALLFGPESAGLPAEVQHEIATHVRIPMLPGIRSMNLANSAAVAVYEAWRQQGFAMPETGQGALTAASP